MKVMASEMGINRLPSRMKCGRTFQIEKLAHAKTMKIIVYFIG